MVDVIPDEQLEFENNPAVTDGSEVLPLDSAQIYGKIENFDNFMLKKYDPIGTLVKKVSMNIGMFFVTMGY